MKILNIYNNSSIDETLKLSRLKALIWDRIQTDLNQSKCNCVSAFPNVYVYDPVGTVTDDRNAVGAIHAHFTRFCRCRWFQLLDILSATEDQHRHDHALLVD